MDIQQQLFRIPDGVFISLGLSWSFHGQSPADLDLSAVSFAKDGRFLDVVYFNHPMPSTGIDAEILRRQYVLQPNELPYMFLSGDSRTGGEEENRVMQLNETSRPPRTSSSVPYNPSEETPKGHRTHNKTHDKIMADTTHFFDQMYIRETFGRHAVPLFHKDSPVTPAHVSLTLAAGQRRPLSDESIVLHMAKIPSEAEYIFICVSSYTGLSFSRLERVKLVLIDETHQRCIGELDLQHATGSGTGNLAACLMRVPGPSQNLESGRAASLPPLHTHLWDFRELNIRASGYTFVDLLSLMLNIMGIPSHSHSDVLRRVPNYSLVKSSPWRRTDEDTEESDRSNLEAGRMHSLHRQNSHVHSLSGTPRTASRALSSAREGSVHISVAGTASHEGMAEEEERDELLADLRFGLGWVGEHDLDAFLVMVDEQNDHVAHLHPKVRRTLSATARRHLGCQHSGDCRCAIGQSGDSESIDVLAYALPKEAQTIVLGATLTNSFPSGAGNLAASSTSRQNAPQSIVDVPGLYLRLQNRTLNNPYAAEVDRWDIYRETRLVDSAIHDGGVRGLCLSGSTAEEALAREGVSSEAAHRISTAQSKRIRTVLLGALVRVGEVALRDLFPEGRSVSEALSLTPTPRTGPQTQNVSREAAETSLTTERQMWLLHQTRVPQFVYVPLRHLVPVDPEHTSFAGVIAYVEAVAAVLAAKMTHPSPNCRTPSLRAFRLALEETGWDQAAGLRFDFVEVIELQPRLPNQFRCHGEVWVHGAGPERAMLQLTNKNNNLYSDSKAGGSQRGKNQRPPNLPFQTSFLTSVENLTWRTSSSTWFVVRGYDRLRVTLFSRAAFGVADIRLLDYGELLGYSGLHRGRSASSKRRNANSEELTVELNCGQPAPGTSSKAKAVVKVRLTCVPIEECFRHMQQRAAEVVEKNTHHAMAVENQFNDRQRQSFNWCAAV